MGRKANTSRSTASLRILTPEKFHLKNAELGAAKAGDFVGVALEIAPKVPLPAKEFASESETEPERPCEAAKVLWSDKDGDHRLGAGLCRRGASVCFSLLFEDHFSEAGTAMLCPQHALDYERDRRPHACGLRGCDRVGFEDEGGFRRCRQHSGTRKPARRRSPSATRPREPAGDDPEQPDLPQPPRDEGDGRVDYRDLKRILTEIRGETTEADKRARAKSPGTHRSPAYSATLHVWACWTPPPRMTCPCWRNFSISSQKAKNLALLRRRSAKTWLGNVVFLYVILRPLC